MTQSFEGIGPAIKAAQPECQPRCPAFTPKVAKKNYQSLRQHVTNVAVQRGWYIYGEGRTRYYEQMQIVLPDTELEELNDLQDDPHSWVAKHRANETVPKPPHDPGELINATVYIDVRHPDGKYLADAIIFAFLAFVALVATLSSSCERSRNVQVGENGDRP